MEFFYWALVGILFLARADDGIVVSGASVQDKPETHKRGSNSRPSFLKANLQKSLQSDAREERQNSWTSQLALWGLYKKLPRKYFDWNRTRLLAGFLKSPFLSWGRSWTVFLNNFFLFIVRLLGIFIYFFLKLLRPVDFYFYLFFVHQLLKPCVRSVFHQIKHFNFQSFHFLLDNCSKSASSLSSIFAEITLQRF